MLACAGAPLCAMDLPNNEPEKQLEKPQETLPLQNQHDLNEIPANAVYAGNIDQAGKCVITQLSPEDSEPIIAEILSRQTDGERAKEAFDQVLGGIEGLVVLAIIGGKIVVVKTGQAAKWVIARVKTKIKAHRKNRIDHAPVTQ